MASDNYNSAFDFVYTDDDGKQFLIEPKTIEKLEKERHEYAKALSELVWKQTQTNYTECAEYMAANFEQMDPVNFYKELFPDNETHEEARMNTHYQQPKAAPHDYV